MPGMLALCLLGIVAGSLWAQPPAQHLDKLNQTPDFLQTDKAAGFTKGGKRYCAPMVASNSLMWLAANGYPKLKPAGPTPKDAQIALIKKLASAKIMDTEDEAKDGTTVGRFLIGLDRYVKECGYNWERLEVQGIAPSITKDWEKARKSRQPNLAWIKEDISHPRGVAWLHFGLYKYDAAKDEYQHSDGHYVTLVGYRGDVFVVHNPAPSAGTIPAHDPLQAQRLSKGTLVNNARRTPADDFYRFVGPSLRVREPLVILENAIVLVMK